MVKKQCNLYLFDTIWGEVDFLSGTLLQPHSRAGKKRLVICEEKYTLSVEKAIAEKLGGIMQTRVVSFSSLADSMKTQKKYLSKTSEVMLLSSILPEIENQLKLYASSVKIPSFGVSVYEILALLCSSFVDFENMKKQQLPPLLAKKVADLCLIWEKYSEAKKDTFCDASDKIQMLFDNFSEVELFKGAEIYFISHLSMTNQMRGLLSKMATFCDLNLLLLNCEETNIANITRDFGEIGVEIKTNEQKTNLSPLQHKIKACENQKRGDTAPSRDDSLFLAIFDSPELEVSHTAKKISHLLQDGVMPEDISVILADFEGELDLYTHAFALAGIPCYASKSLPLSSFSLPQYMCDVINLQIKNFGMQEIIKVLKSPLCPLSFENRCELENYIIAKNLSRNRFLKPGNFAPEILLAYESFIKNCTNLFPTLASGEEYCNAVLEFLRKTAEKLSSATSELASLGMVEDADFFVSSISKTAQTAREFADIAKNKFFSLEDFKNIIISGLASKEIAIIPPHLHGVEIVGVAKAGMKNTPHTFLCGARGATFPAVKTDTALLSDKDISTLSFAGVEISPTTLQSNITAESEAGLSLLSANKYLQVSFSKQMGSGGSSKSTLFESLEKVSKPCELSQYHYSCELLSLSLEECFLPQNAEKVARTEISSETSQSGLISLFAREVAKENPVSQKIAKLLFASFKNAGKEQLLGEISAKNQILYMPSGLARNVYSVSHIQRYYRCPYQSFLSQNMRLRNREVGVFKPFDTGNFLHNVLEEFAVKMPHLSESEISLEVAKISANAKNSPELAKFSQTERFDYIFSALEKEASKICKHIYKTNQISQFSPKFHEFQFGDSTPFSTDGGLRLHGKVDRIDTCGGDFIILDYKTGTVSTDSNSYYYGTNIQSELYLYSMSKILKKRGVGCFYFPISDNYGDKEVSYKLEGKLLAIPDVIEKLDPNVQPQTASEIFPFSLTKHNVPTKSKSALQQADFESYIEKSAKTAENAEKEIAKGYMIASPYKKTCDYCEFASICKTCGENAKRGDREEENDN